jgi:hypothetical protein
MPRPLHLLPLLLLTACQSLPTSAPQPWTRTDLYLGLTRQNNSLIPDAEFQHFVDIYITPLFPDGFTLTPALGQYLDTHHTLHQEPTRILTILYPTSTAQETNHKLQQLITAYCHEENQESVLRTDTPQHAEFLSPPAH